MNGAEQRERFTAVSRIEARMADVELIVTELAKNIVTDRQQADTQHQALIDAVNHAIGTALAEARVHVDLEDRKNECAIGDFRHMPFWQRLRWFVRGVS